MVDVATPKTSAPPPSKTVQDYIDELPMWSDGTTLKSTPMTGMQWLIWTLAAFGKFFEGFVVFMGGVTVPLIAREFHLASSQKGLVTSASLAGILVGTMLLGGLSDYFGRKRMFIAEMIIFCLFLALLILVQDFWSLVICLFGIGMALGCDYPTAHMIISAGPSSAPERKLVLPPNAPMIRSGPRSLRASAAERSPASTWTPSNSACSTRSARSSRINFMFGPGSAARRMAASERISASEPVLLRYSRRVTPTAASSDPRRWRNPARFEDGMTEESRIG